MTSDASASTPLQAAAREGVQEPAHLRGLLLLDYIVYIVVSALSEPARKSRVEVPSAPTFVERVHEGNVDSVSAKATPIEGIFDAQVRHPDEDTTGEERLLDGDTGVRRNQSALPAPGGRRCRHGR